MSYSVVIGLEVHAQLSTKTKMFCGCKVEFGAEPNTHVCPVCLGMPGTLPVPNAKAVEYAIKMGLACGAKIDPKAMWTRKNYFYPDLPKGYQITQQGEVALYDRPICTEGHLEIDLDDGTRKRIGLKRIHMEEDAGKLIHDLTVADSLFDANRCGTPLIEIVSNPDLRSPREAYLYLEKLKQILEYLEICDANMEQGNLRCDANVSLRKDEFAPFGNRVELKNMNSFHNIEKALQAEIELQAMMLDRGEVIQQQTKRWDVAKGVTVALRTKEEAHDYRYFPDPDLLPLELTQEYVDELAKGLPELPDAKRARFIKDYGLPPYDAGVLVAERETADYYEAMVKAKADPKAAANWLINEYFGRLNKAGLAINDGPIPAASNAAIVLMVSSGEISGKIAKDLIDIVWAEGGDPRQIVEKRGMRQVTDTSAIEKAVDDIIAANPKQAEQVKVKPTTIGWFVGQVMKATGGKANPGLVNEMLKRKFGVE